MVLWIWAPFQVESVLTVGRLLFYILGVGPHMVEGADLTGWWLHSVILSAKIVSFDANLLEDETFSLSVSVGYTGVINFAGSTCTQLIWLWFEAYPTTCSCPWCFSSSLVRSLIHYVVDWVMLVQVLKGLSRLDAHLFETDYYLAISLSTDATVLVPTTPSQLPFTCWIHGEIRSRTDSHCKKCFKYIAKILVLLRFTWKSAFGPIPQHAQTLLRRFSPVT
jgi:hypothetical protein